jgi:DNA damage-binding protein 1
MSELARKYHNRKDGEASKAFHEQRAVEVKTNDENHGSSGDIIKSVVLGGLDGIITTFAIVCAVAGSGELGSKVVILMGVANLVADAISMGLGDFLSERAENDYVAKEQAREEWEMENFLEGEISEMADIYVAKGFERQDALDILNKMVKNKQFFLEHMMVEEIGVMPVDPNAAPGKKGYNSMTKDAVFSIASSAVAVTLFGLGCLKSKLIQGNLWEMASSGLETLGLGGVACTTSYLIGWGLEKLMNVQGAC